MINKLMNESNKKNENKTKEDIKNNNDVKITELSKIKIIIYLLISWMK